MNKILSINNDIVTVLTQEFNLQQDINISGFTRGLDSDSNLLYFSCSDSGTVIEDSYSIWGPISYQQLWQAYINNVMDFTTVQTEATSRSIDTTDKTQDQLARAIIQYECSANSKDFLLSVEGMSVGKVKIESVPKTDKPGRKKKK